jgi:hypothetical protein
MKKIIQMKLNQSTIYKVEELKFRLKEKNRTQIVVEAITLYLEIVKAIQDGAKIIIEYKDGTRERLVLVR